MDWVRIEPGCEMPEDGEIVLISDIDDWVIAIHSFGKFYPVDEYGYACMSDTLDGAKHWARPELPKN